VQTGNLAVPSRNGYRKIDADPPARQGRAPDQPPIEQTVSVSRPLAREGTKACRDTQEAAAH
jgi:hypothetical protein